jgi:hypothetical protein
VKRKFILLVLVIGCIIIAGVLAEWSEQRSVTGKISSFTYNDESLETYTTVTFTDGTSIAFQGHLLFTVGEEVTIKYHSFGILWEMLGFHATNSVDYITK